VADVARAVGRILSVTDQSGLGVYLLPDPLSHSFFISAILPRSRYDEDLRRDLEKLLRTKYGATHTDNRVSFVDDQIALIHFFCSASGDIDLDALKEIERDVQSRVARWEEGLESALLEREPEERAYGLVDEYGRAFPESYQVVTPGHLAVQDVEGLERLRAAGGKAQLDLQVEGADLCRLKVYQTTRPYLTDLLPTLDHFDLRVLDATLTEVTPASGDVLWIVTVRIDGLHDFDSESHARLLEALRRTLSGQVRDDELHALVLRVGLDWSEVSLLRAYLAYAHQIGTSPSRRFLTGVLAAYPEATRALAGLFRARFDPDLAGARSEAEQESLRSLEQARAQIRTAAEDRVFSLISNLIESTVRTSYFAAPIGPDPLIALKLDPSRIHQMPAPRPFAEIYVHSAAMSGIHLRGGPVARGGVRWSDRPGDFRTEILGLMKTQMVKNGLIVPVGSKGGFVLLPPASAPRDPKEVERQYARFIRGLLSVTDDRVGGQVAAPDRVVCHDGPDPYLVVAPDKGTARFSDVANRVAEQGGFWLGDAFASGGSEGYDHKREGITARGAWVCILRHFQELGLDVEREPFTVAGIGDMSGDVFGNGMLLARQAKLLAAFNHLHILLDPTPDPEVSWQERKRLFDLQSSSWSDYDPAKISEGGGVYDRSAKEIPLSSQAQEMLGTDQLTLSGEELVRAILRMPVDLLLNGGIGTYVKASDESHADVGDRANDSVRVDAPSVRARVVGEGGNLGLTPRARVEFALAGGRINTDAIDNSGGVDLSDHEVNFKILVAPASRAGILSRPERNRILSECLPEAVEAVLSNNASQSLCLSLDERRSREAPESFLGATEFLARRGGLDPKLEGLPDPEEIRERAASRAGPVYTRPELAVLVGYTKMLAKRSLLESVVPDLKVFGHLVEEYFPVALRDRFREDIPNHPLRREILATVLANRVIDPAGVTLLPGLTEGLGVDGTDALAAYQLAGRILDADRIREALHVETLPDDERLAALIRLEDSVRSAARTLIGLERQTPWSAAALESWGRGQRDLREHLARENGSIRLRVDEALTSLCAAGLPQPLAEELAWLPAVVRALPVLPLVEGVCRSLGDVVRAWVRIGEVVRVSDLLDRLDAEGRQGGWDRLAAEGLTLELLDAQRQLTAAALMRGEAGVGEFLHDRHTALERIGSTVDRIEGEPTLAPAAFLVQQLRRLC
jgi:glutamate dehydrogenase